MMKKIHFSTKSERKDYGELCEVLKEKKRVNAGTIRSVVKNAFLHRTKFDVV
jgi:hypothetical protein